MLRHTSAGPARVRSTRPVALGRDSCTLGLGGYSILGKLTLLEAISKLRDFDREHTIYG